MKVQKKVCYTEPHKEFTERHREVKESGSGHDKTTDAVFEQFDVEVDQKTNFTVRELEIRQYLGFMHWSNLLHYLQFHNYLLFHQQIKSVALVEMYFFIDQGQSLLAFNCQTQTSSS